MEPGDAAAVVAREVMVVGAVVEGVGAVDGEEAAVVLVTVDLGGCDGNVAVEAAAAAGMVTVVVRCVVPPVRDSVTARKFVAPTLLGEGDCIR